MSTKADTARSPKKNDLPQVDKLEQRSRAPGPFDVVTVQALVSLMTEHDLSEIDLREGNQRLRLRRGYQPTLAAPVAAVASPAPAPGPTAAPAKSDAAPAAAPAGKPLVDIKSPVVGTFYVAAKPGDPPFVKAGSKVNPDTVVCLIEAMKIFNEIQAECSGVIREVMVENQQPVEFGQVLFRVDPAG